MRGLGRPRLYRLLLPALLILAVAGLVSRLEPPDGAHTTSPIDLDGPRAKATGVRAVDFQGGAKRFEIDAGSIAEDADGRVRLEDVRELKVFRASGGPVSVQAASGAIEGAKGHRLLRFDRQVTFRDPERGLTLRIPALVVDEAAGEARADAAVELEGGGLAGHATAMVYGLAGQPTVLTALALENPARGAAVHAGRALLHDGLDDLELLDGVRATRAGDRFSAARVRVWRGAEGRLRRGEAGGVLKATLTLARGTLDLTAASVEAEFDLAGAPARLVLRGVVTLRRGADQLAAERVEALHEAAGWRVFAEQRVELRGQFADGAAWLRAEGLEALLDAELRPIEGQARGQVTLDGVDLRAEADRASFAAAPGSAARIALVGSAQRRARLARAQLRLTAERIVTDARGSALVGEGRVEATLLPAPRRGGPGLFDLTQAVHFVAARIEATDSGAAVELSGAVRGWQGERNLSAERVRLDQRERVVLAEQSVTSRFPRTRGAAAGTAEHVQVLAERLEYRESERTATYRGAVRVHVAEGWIEAQLLEVQLGAAGSEIDEVRAAGEVRVEFREPGDAAPPKLVSGTADRLVYRPREAQVWLSGDKSPAAVRRIGDPGGVTTGRVLRYQLELGTLEVDSGAGAPGQIRTGRGG